MSYATELREHKQNVMLQMTDKPQVSSTVGENFTMGVGQTIDAGLSVSESFVRGFDVPFTDIRIGGNFSFDKRDDELKKMRTEGTISDDEWSAFTPFVEFKWGRVRRTDYSKLGQYINERDGTGYKTNEEIDSNMRDALKTRKAMAQDVYQRQTGMGAAAQLAGGFAAYGLEPMNALAMVAEPVLLAKNAYALSQASTRLGRALIAGRTAAKVGIATELAIQPILFNWNEKIGEDMTWTDALINVAAVGVLSGAVGMAASGLRTKAKFEKEQVAAKLSLAEKGITAGEFAGLIRTIRESTKEVVSDKEADELLEQAENILKGSDPDTPAVEVMQKMDETEAQINAQTTKADDYDEYDYDASVDQDYEALMALDAETGLKDLGEVDMGADPFGFEEFALTRLERGQKAIDEIEAMNGRERSMQICLTGKAP